MAAKVHAGEIGGEGSQHLAQPGCERLWIQTERELLKIKNHDAGQSNAFGRKVLGIAMENAGKARRPIHSLNPVVHPQMIHHGLRGPKLRRAHPVVDTIKIIGDQDIVVGTTPQTLQGSGRTHRPESLQSRGDLGGMSDAGLIAEQTHHFGTPLLDPAPQNDGQLTSMAARLTTTQQGEPGHVTPGLHSLKALPLNRRENVWTLSPDPKVSKDPLCLQGRV